MLVPGIVTVHAGYRTHRVSILDAIDQPSASRNLSQNQLIWRFTDWATVSAFNTGCPGAPATVRRRLAAIAHHHRTAGHPAPADPARDSNPLSRELIDPGQVDMLMRLLPSHGWIGGLFGRRDRALLTLAAATTVPYRQRPG